MSLNKEGGRGEQKVGKLLVPTQSPKVFGVALGVGFREDLARKLRDPEFATYFYNAQVESAKELLRCGIITALDETGDSNITEVIVG